MIPIIYLASTIVLCFIYGEKIKKLEKRIQSMEDFLLGKVIAENEVDD